MAKVPRVLLVDPDFDTAVMYAAGLEGAGFDVVRFHTFEALFAGSHGPIQAIVMEWEYLTTPALDLIHRIRSSPTLKTIPILILTNCDGDVERLRDEAINAGAQSWHVKVNTTPSMLAERVAESLITAA